MSSFDLDSFMTSTITEANDTRRIPIPEGEYQAVVTKLDPKTTSSGRLVFELTWKIDDENVRQVTGIPEPQVRQSLWIDLTDHGTLDLSKGKNIDLGKVREAFGMNVPGKPFAPQMLVGNVAMINVKHRMYNDEPIADVKGVRKL